MKILTSLILMIFLSSPALAFEEEFSSSQPNRTGFFLSGIAQLGSELIENQRLSAGAGLRIGGGISDNITFYLEARGSWVDQSAFSDLFFADFQAKIQIYPVNDFYFNLGLGLASGRVTVGKVFPVTDYEVGLGLSAGLGYEFRITKRMFIAPELSFDYRRLGSKNYFTPNLGVVLGAHF